MVITINGRKMLSGYNIKFTILTTMLNSLITGAENLKGSLLLERTSQKLFLCVFGTIFASLIR